METFFHCGMFVKNVIFPKCMSKTSVCIYCFHLK